LIDFIIRSRYSLIIRRAKHGRKRIRGDYFAGLGAGATAQEDATLAVGPAATEILLLGEARAFCAHLARGFSRKA
jgi:hypothetical protein